MQILPVTTPLLKEGDDLASVLADTTQIEENDILVVSSKAVATVEGAAIDLSTITASEQAHSLCTHGTKTPEHYQVIIDETARMNGECIQSSFGIILTELKPNGMKE